MNRMEMMVARVIIAVVLLARIVAGFEPPRDRASEDWPIYHFSALPEEGRCRPFDPNGCIFWEGKYHLMYIYRDATRGHSWGHASSTDLVHWIVHPPALVPRPEDADIGIYSGNALVSKEGAPMLCWNGISAGVCVATAQDADLIRWKRHPGNPIIPSPRKGEPEYGVYRTGDPFLWLEGDTYYCALGGNRLEDGEDTLYLLKSSDLVRWENLHPLYRAEPSWTVENEDMSCPDLFELGDKHVLLGISHNVGARCYVGRYENERFYPEQHVRMNWLGAKFFAPESLLDDKGRRIFWAWVTDPRLVATQVATGSGVMSLPRVLSLSDNGTLRITPVEELEALRRNLRVHKDVSLAAGTEVTLPELAGKALELALEIDPGTAQTVGLKVRCSPDGSEETGVWYDSAAGKLKIDMSRSTLRKDVIYLPGPIDRIRKPSDWKRAMGAVAAPFRLRAGEMLKLRLFLDGPMLEVFANDRQCLTQQIFPARKDSLLVRLVAQGGSATVRSLRAWDMAPATFRNEKNSLPDEDRILFADRFQGRLGEGWSWLREDAANWCIRENALEIRVEPGVATTVKNALVRTAPDRSQGRYGVQVTVTNHTEPTQKYEQAGITWYRGGKPVFKIVKELVDGELVIIPGRKPMASERVQLRLIVDEDSYIAQYRPEARGKFETAATGKLPPPSNDQVSLQCYNGPEDAEHWIRFDDFRIFRMPD